MAVKSGKPLSRQRVLEAAIQVADKGGVQALSMRKVAAELEVEAMSLYHHVANKDEILDGVVDALFAKIEFADPEAHWKDAMRVRAASARSVLAAHPWALGLMESRGTSGPAIPAHHNAVLGALRNGGFSVAMSAHAFSVLDSYIYGFALQEANLPFDSADALDEAIDDLDLEAMAEAAPHLVELVTEHVLQPGYSFADEFDFGLDLILDALEGKLSS